MEAAARSLSAKQARSKSDHTKASLQQDVAGSELWIQETWI